jgi:hypothetical protein
VHIATRLWNLVPSTCGIEFVFMLSLTLSSQTQVPVHVDLNGSYWTVKSAPSLGPSRVSEGFLNIDRGIKV